MSLRIRKDGRILCAAMHPAEPGDTYIHDGISYTLTVELHAIVTDKMHLRAADGSVGHGQWWWANRVPEGIEIDRWWETERDPLRASEHRKDCICVACERALETPPCPGYEIMSDEPPVHCPGCSHGAASADIRPLHTWVRVSGDSRGPWLIRCLDCGDDAQLRLDRLGGAAAARRLTKEERAFVELARADAGQEPHSLTRAFARGDRERLLAIIDRLTGTTGGTGTEPG